MAGTKLALIPAAPEQYAGSFAGMLLGYLWGSKNKHPILGVLIGGALGNLGGMVLSGKRKPE